jgi:hypothetical protein
MKKHENKLFSRWEHNPKMRKRRKTSRLPDIKKSSRLFFDNSTACNNGNDMPAERWNFKYDAFGQKVEAVQESGGVMRTTSTAYDAEGCGVLLRLRTLLAYINKDSLSHSFSICFAMACYGGSYRVKSHVIRVSS